MPQEIVKFVSVSKSFRQGKKEVNVLQDASFTLHQGEKVALVGQSGSGKTTLLQIIGLLDNADGGEIFIDNKCITDLNDDARTALRRDTIGFVYQFHQLLPEFTAEENVMLPLLIQGVKKAEAKQRAAKILGDLQLGNRLEHRPAELSGGEQQRVAIARAIVGNPALILADEPTGNLDVQTADIIFDVLLEMVEKYNTTLFVVTHNLELAKRTDRQLYITHGTVQSASIH